MKTEEQTQESPKTKEEQAVDEIFESQFPSQENEEQENEKELKKEEGPEKEEEAKKTEETEEKLKEEVKKEEKTKEEKIKETDEEATKLLQELGLQKFKNIEDALRAYKELESAFGKAQATIQAYQRGVIPQEIKEGVEGAINLVSRPRVRFEAPDPESYNLEDGTFDIQSYITDALNNYTLSLQKSLVFGELATALYTVLSRALVDKYSNLEEKIKTDKEAEEIASEIETLFPQLKEDEELSDLYEKAVLGFYQKKGQPLTKQEFIDIAKKITSLKYKSQPKSSSQTEVGGFTGQMSSTESALKTPKTKEEEAVDEIFEEALNKKNILF